MNYLNFHRGFMKTNQSIDKKKTALFTDSRFYAFTIRY